MSRFSNLDEKIFFEFKDDLDSLKLIAKQIKGTISDEDLIQKLYRIPDEEEDEIQTVKEGRVIYKLHKYKERKSKISKQKKEVYYRKNGKLDCEICGFDFYEKYGELGEGFMECHHRTRLSMLTKETETTLNDLALVCANCHRILHQKIDTSGVEELKQILKQ